MDLIDRVQEVFPNALPLWTGRENPDTAALEWHDVKIIVSRSESGDGYDIGFYPGGAWHTAQGSFLVMTAPTADDVLAHLDEATERADEAAMLAYALSCGGAKHDF